MYVNLTTQLISYSTGTVAGVYAGMEYGVKRIRGTSDWVISSSNDYNLQAIYYNPQMTEIIPVHIDDILSFF